METKKITLSLEETSLNNIINFLRSSRRFSDKIQTVQIEMDVCEDCNLDKVKENFILSEKERLQEDLNNEIRKNNPDYEEIKRISNLLKDMTSNDESPVE